MKKISIILSILMCSLGIMNVEAKQSTFIDNDKEYTLELNNIECANGMHFDRVEENGSFLFWEEDTEKYYRVVDNTCTVLKNQEYLDLMNEEFSYYSLEEDSNGDFNVVKRTHLTNKIEKIIKTKDTQPVEGKEYFQIFDENSMGTAIPNGDMSNYYERIYVDYPESTEIKDITYYKENGVFAIEKVEEPQSEEILSYYVASTKDNVEKEEVVFTLDAKFKDIIGTKRAEVVKANYNDVYYILVEKSITDEGMFYFDVYNLKAELVFENVNWILPHEELYIIIKDDNTYFYNLNKELLHKEEAVLHNSIYNIKTKIMHGAGVFDNKEVVFKLAISSKMVEPEKAPGEEVPQTSDNILTSFMVGGMSLIVLIGLLYYMVKEKRKRA